MSDNLYPKYQRIASAFYLITSFFPDQEPLKWRLRNLATDLVSNAVRDKLAVTREITSLLNVAKNAQIISGTNCEILIQEISKLESEIEKPLGLMFPPDSSSAIPSTKEPTNVPEKLTSSNQYFVSDTPLPIKDKLLPSTSHFQTDDKSTLREFGAVSVKKNARQSVIIALLKRKKEIMIKDVSPLISGCSEKTIQRELLEMVSQGILTKLGEKRWTRYSLAKIA